jgi:hypothetical protein
MKEHQAQEYGTFPDEVRNPSKTIAKMPTSREVMRFCPVDQ